MSIRELRALLEAGGGNEGSRCIRRACRRMTELEQDGPASWRKRVEELETQLLAATTALTEKDRDLSLQIDYRRLDWCSLPLICSAGDP